MSNIIYTLERARSALNEYYRDDAPIITDIEQAMVDVGTLLDFKEKAFQAHPNIDLDIDYLAK